MIAREWRVRLPLKYKAKFLVYLEETGVHDASNTLGYQGSQILSREYKDQLEVVLTTYWDNFESISGFAGSDVNVARLYPGDERYELDSDPFVRHYEVHEHAAQE